MAETPLYLILGKILRPHGVRGELRVKIMTDYPERLVNGEVDTVFLGSGVDDANAVAYDLTKARFHKSFVLLTLSGINNRDEAELLRNQFVMINIDNAIPLDEDEYYVYEVIGLTVQTADGEELGVLQSVMETGANDVYVVSGRAYGKLLLPAHEETIDHIDFEAGIITMTLPDGLLPNQSDS